MGVTSRGSGPRVLLVPVPGAVTLRLEAEVLLGPRAASSPAEAAVLLVAGRPGAALREAVETVWEQMPGPRARALVSEPGTVRAALDDALARLADHPAQRADARRRGTSPPAAEDAHTAGHGDDGGHHAHGHESHERDGHGDHGPGHGRHGSPAPGGAADDHSGHASGHGAGGHDHGGHGDMEMPGGAADDHGGHASGHGAGGHGHGGHGGMEMPDGLPMADRAPDRDGLQLDVLHVPLGPVLPYWSAGLVIDTRLQGDVVQEAAARVLPGEEEPLPEEFPGAVRPLDSLQRLLGVAGWEQAAGRARVLRDRLLAGEPAEAVRADLVRWRRRVERSRLLRSATDGLGVLDGEDATARWRRWTEQTEALLGGDDAVPPGSHHDAHTRLDAAVAAMPGLELHEARLLLASLDPDTDAIAAAQEVAS